MSLCLAWSLAGGDDGCLTNHGPHKFLLRTAQRKPSAETVCQLSNASRVVYFGILISAAVCNFGHFYSYLSLFSLPHPPPGNSYCHPPAMSADASAGSPVNAWEDDWERQADVCSL